MGHYMTKCPKKDLWKQAMDTTFTNFSFGKEDSNTRKYPRKEQDTSAESMLQIPETQPSTT